MKTFAASALFATLALSALAPTAAQAAFVFGDELLPGRNLGLTRIDAEAAKAAAEAYYDFDALIGFGTLVLAGAALAAVGAAFSRRSEEKTVAQREGEDWRDAVLRGLEQDLARFTGRLRRAA
jgi:hypothetical protein